MTTAESIPLSRYNPIKTENVFLSRTIMFMGEKILVRAKVRYDDALGNGQNSFCITGATFDENRNPLSAGRCDAEIAKAFPELAPFQKWNNTTSRSPIHYIHNSLYWAGHTKWTGPNLENFRKTAVWPDASADDMNNPELERTLTNRLPGLMLEFKAAVESLGFVF